MGTEQQELDRLLRQAGAADGLHRMDFRDPIAAFGATAVNRLEPWLLDRRLSAFAIRTTAAAARRGATEEAVASLRRARARADPEIRRDIDTALAGLGSHARGAVAPRTRAQPGTATLRGALDELRGVTDEWRRRGSPAQGPTKWRKADWGAAFAAHATFLARQPRLLDRAAVRRGCQGAVSDPGAAEAAFILSKAWGEGMNGYGCSRALESFELTDSIGDRLMAVARTLRDDGPVAAYARLGDDGDCRIFNLGPAFGTKYLYFAQPAAARPQALIHDSVVARWLLEHAGLRLGADVWSVSRYRAYLELAHDWAEELACAPDEVELNIFRSSLPPTSRWAGI